MSNDMQNYYDFQYHVDQHGGNLLGDYSLPSRIAFFQMHCCSPQCSVLDFGCGTGGVLSGLRDISITGSVGIDVSRSAIASAKAAFPAYRWERVEIGGDLPGVGPFDLVVSSEVIEHVFDVDDYLQRLRSALVLGGTLGLTCPFHGLWKDLVIILAGKSEHHFHNPYDPHIRFYSLRSLKEVLTKNGFDFKLARPICPRFGVSALARMIGVKAIKR